MIINQSELNNLISFMTKPNSLKKIIEAENSLPKQIILTREVEDIADVVWRVTIKPYKGKTKNGYLMDDNKACKLVNSILNLFRPYA